MVITKRDFIEEGVLDFVKNNYGKGIVAAGAIGAAKAGVFGDGTKAVTNTGIEKTTSWMKQSSDKIAKEYGAKKANPPEKKPVENEPDENPLDHITDTA